MPLSRIWAVCSLVCWSAATAMAGTVTYTGAGGNLPDATVNTGPLVPGVFASNLTVSGNYSLPATGVNVTLTLVGFYHPFAGDLIVELVNLTNNVTATVFARICKTTPAAAYPDPDPGCLADFSPGASNYVFRDDAANDLWVVAAGLGDADAIPTDEYIPSLALTGAPSNLSVMFNGLDPNGDWQLRITDLYPDSDTDAPPVYRGSLQAWQLTLTSVPEPGTAGAAGAGLLALAGWAWRRRGAVHYHRKDAFIAPEREELSGGGCEPWHRSGDCKSSGRGRCAHDAGGAID